LRTLAEAEAREANLSASCLVDWQTRRTGDEAMLKWALIFAVAALVLAILGFGGLAGAAIEIAKILFWLAVIIAVLLFVLGFTVYRKVT
jgi:uncharacterized membrane protein YtjA (UPF0391 family)